MFEGGNEKTRPQAIVALLAWIVASAGCGGANSASVSGMVTRRDGKPAEGVRVIARSSATGKWASGMTDAVGHYQLRSANGDDGLAAGDYEVTIVEDQGGMDNAKPPTINARYGNPEQSGLSLSVAAGETKAFNVTVDPP